MKVVRLIPHLVHEVKMAEIWLSSISRYGESGPRPEIGLEVAPESRLALLRTCDRRKLALRQLENGEIEIIREADVMARLVTHDHAV